jgi:hypothetical protein
MIVFFKLIGVLGVGVLGFTVGAALAYLMALLH